MSILAANSLHHWAETLIADQPPRAKSLVMTLFGDVIRPHGGQLWLGSLIRLLAPFGISDRLVRTSVYRLAEEGWLSAQREGRRSQYTLQPEALQRFQHAYNRIYAPTYLAWDGQWTLVFTLAGELSAKQRADLRKELLWEGFAALAPSAFIHPNPHQAILRDILLHSRCAGAVYVSRVEDAELRGTKTLNELVEQCWDLSHTQTSYQQFIDRFNVVAASLKQEPLHDPELAFIIRSLVIHEYRRVHLHDPQFPLDLLPDNWEGKTAYELCRYIYQHCHAASQRYIVETLNAEDANTPEAADFFYERFGGLESKA